MLAVARQPMPKVTLVPLARATPLSTGISMIYQYRSTGIHRWHRTREGMLLQQLEKCLWLSNVTFLPDEHLRVKSLHLGCAHK